MASSVTGSQQGVQGWEGSGNRCLRVTHPLVAVGTGSREVGSLSFRGGGGPGTSCELEDHTYRVGRSWARGGIYRSTLPAWNGGVALVRSKFYHPVEVGVAEYSLEVCEVGSEVAHSVVFTSRGCEQGSFVYCERLRSHELGTFDFSEAFHGSIDSRGGLNGDVDRFDHEKWEKSRLYNVVATQKCTDTSKYLGEAKASRDDRIDRSID